METKNHYTRIDYGQGKKLTTRNEALKYAEGEVIPNLLNNSGLDIIGKPEIVEGKKEGLMYVVVPVRE
ncbi:MAG: hypothetical protein HFJ19_05595 [Clostridia bacterium]|nr:hypothetical protein [Clostridia bacterium]